MLHVMAMVMYLLVHCVSPVVVCIVLIRAIGQEKVQVGEGGK